MWPLVLWLNLSPSLPIGVYRSVSDPVRRGAIVVVCLPADIGAFARARGYLSAGPCPGDVERLGKIVAGVPGDTIDVDTTGVRINGRAIAASRPLPRDTRGRELPRWRGRAVVRPGELFLLATVHARSFDGRYFGPVAVRDLVVVRPWWIIAWRNTCCTGPQAAWPMPRRGRW